MAHIYLPDDANFQASSSQQAFEQYTDGLLQASAQRFWQQLQEQPAQQALDTFLRFAPCACCWLFYTALDLVDFAHCTNTRKPHICLRVRAGFQLRISARTCRLLIL